MLEEDNILCPKNLKQQVKEMTEEQLKSLEYYLKRMLIITLEEKETRIKLKKEFI